MALSKRLRFEILRRDGHTCRYCGAKAPAVRLLVDHVVPEALGGRTEPDNLVASCEPCNSGKSSTSPDSTVVAQVSADALRWSAAIRRAADDMLARRDALDAELDQFLEAWNSGRAFARLDDNWEGSVLRFRAAGLPMPLLLDALRKAHANRKVAGPEVFRYMCGIAWSMVTEMQEAARAAIGASGSRGETLDAREELAKDLLALVYEQHPDITADGLESAYAELNEPADERAIAGEDSVHILGIANALFTLMGYLCQYRAVVDQGLYRLPSDLRAEVERRLEHDLYCAGEENANEIDRTVHRMRHVFGLIVRADE